jgi:hypothetical protein
VEVVGIGQEFVTPPLIISKGVRGNGPGQGVEGMLTLCVKIISPPLKKTLQQSNSFIVEGFFSPIL